MIWFRFYRNVYMLIDHYAILFDNEFDNYDFHKLSCIFFTSDVRMSEPTPKKEKLWNY